MPYDILITIAIRTFPYLVNLKFPNSPLLHVTFVSPESRLNFIEGSLPKFSALSRGNGFLPPHLVFLNNC